MKSNKTIMSNSDAQSQTNQYVRSNPTCYKENKPPNSFNNSYSAQVIQLQKDIKSLKLEKRGLESKASNCDKLEEKIRLLKFQLEQVNKKVNL